MMQTLRNPRVLKYGLWAILVLTIPSFVLFYGFGDTGGSSPDMPFRRDAFVTVQGTRGKVKIGTDEMRAAKSELANQYVMTYMLATGRQPERRDLSRIESGLSNRQVAEYAVSMVAFNELGDAQSIMVSNDQVSRQLREQGVTGAQFRSFLQQQGMREADFLRQERFRLRDARVQDLVGSMAKVSLLELWLEHKLENDRLRVEYVKAPVANFLDDVAASDEEIETYYQANLDRYIKPAERVYRFVVKGVEDTPDSAYEVAEERVRELYAALDPAVDADVREESGRIVRHIMLAPAEGESRDEALARAEEIRRRLVEDEENFAVVANLENQDTQAQAGGLVRGRLNDATRGLFEERYGAAWVEGVGFFDEMVVSNVFESNGNFFIVRVDRISDGKLPFDRARPVLEARIRTELRAADEVRRAAELQRLQREMSEASAARTSIESIARSLELEVQTTSPTLAASYFLPEIGDLTSHSDSLRRLGVGEISPVMLADRTNRLAIVQVAEVIPERNRRLDEVRSDVEAAVLRDKASELAKAAAEQVAARVRGGDSATSAAAELNLVARETAEPFGRLRRPVDLMGVEDFPNLTLRAEAGDVLVARSGFGDFTDSWLALRIVAKQEPDKREFLQQMQELELGLNMAKRRMFVQEFRRDALTAMKVEYDEDFVRESEGPRRRRD